MKYISYIVELDYFDETFIKIKPCPEKFYFGNNITFIIQVNINKVSLLRNKTILGLLCGNDIQIKLALNLLL